MTTDTNNRAQRLVRAWLYGDDADFDIVLAEVLEEVKRERAQAGPTSFTLTVDADDNMR